MTQEKLEKEIQKSTLLLQLLCLALLLTFGIGTTVFSKYKNLINQEKVSHQLERIPNLKSTETHPLLFHDQRLFQKGTQSQPDQKSLSIPEDAEVKGGIVPHHLLASPVIAHFFEQLRENTIITAKQNQPITFIILGPNHYNRGKGKVLTSTWDWQAPKKKISADHDIISNLLTNSTRASVVPIKITDDPETLTHEHSIGVLIPFIEHYFPRSKIVPVILSSKMSLADAQALSEMLLPHARQPHTIVISSIDFSHNLSQEQASQKDQETKELMRQKKYDQLLTQTSDHLDSGPALVTQLLLMEKLQQKSFTILSNHNSSKFVEDHTLPVTSYIEAIFFQ